MFDGYSDDEDIEKVVREIKETGYSSSVQGKKEIMQAMDKWNNEF